MKQVKEARNQGNHAAANRHATELIQYLGIGSHESPIEQALANASSGELDEFDDAMKFQAAKKVAENFWSD